jgi:hypothetical protein
LAYDQAQATKLLAGVLSLCRRVRIIGLVWLRLLPLGQVANTARRARPGE